MLIHKAYKFRLYPTKDQKQDLLQHGGNARFIWNYFLDLNSKHYQKTKKFIFGYELISLLPELKKELSFLSISVAQSLQQVGRHFDKALKDFLDKKQLNKRFPVHKFKDKMKDSFSCPQKFKVSKNFVRIPKIGKVKWIKHRTINGKIKSITISQDGELWFCSVLTEQNIIVPEFKEDNIVGVDLGIKEFAVFSDETVVNNPRTLNKNTKKLRRLQQGLSRKKKGSNNRKKARILVAKQHRRIRNIRKDFQDKQTHNMIAKYDGFVLENLNVSGIIKNHCLAKVVSDVAWYSFRKKLEYKSLWFGKHVIIIDRWEPTSKTCNNCGWKNKDLTLKDRTFICKICGYIEDRDLNAAKNIREIGLKILSDRQESTLLEIEPLSHKLICETSSVVEGRKRSTVKLYEALWESHQ
jgi:putative transposase